MVRAKMYSEIQIEKKKKEKKAGGKGGKNFLDR